MRACRFSSVRSALEAVERLGEGGLERLHHRLDRQRQQLDAEVLGQPLGVAAGARGGVRRGHRHARHAVGPERVDGDQRDERRVDAAAEPEHDVLEAVLRDVVARAEHERPVDLLDDVERRRDRVLAERRVARALADGEGAEPLHGAVDAGGRRAAARVAQARRAGGDGVDLGEQQRLLKLRRAGDDRALVIDDERVAVEDELVLAADERAERDRGEIVAGALGDHPLALDALAHVIGRGGDVHDQARAGERLV